jgi:hypothetical protein
MDNPTVSTYMEINPAIFAGTLENGMLFSVEALPEFLDAVDYWFKETDCFDTHEAAKEHAYKSDNPFWWCVARVTVKKPENGKSERDYLSACNYENGMAFIRSAYFSDMISNCINALVKD